MKMLLQIANGVTSIFILVTTLETSKIGNFYSYHNICIIRKRLTVKNTMVGDEINIMKTTFFFKF